MKKMYLPLTFLFAFGLTTHSALCMENKEEKNKKILLVKLQELKKEYEEAIKRNSNLSLEQPISGYLILNAYPYPLEINSWEISNQKLIRMEHEIGELQKTLDMGTKKISYGKDPIPETQNESREYSFLEFFLKDRGAF